MVGSVRTGSVGDADGGSGGGMNGGGGGDLQDADIDELKQWNDNVELVTLGTETNASLAYDTGFELHHPIISELGYPRSRLEIYIYMGKLMTGKSI